VREHFWFSLMHINAINEKIFTLKKSYIGGYLTGADFIINFL
jgi:hypothetical protein